MNPPMDNGAAFMRAQRAAMQRAAQQQAAMQRAISDYYSAYSPLLGGNTSRQDPPMAGTPGEREAEDVTGLRMLDEFLEAIRARKAAGGKGWEPKGE